MSDIEEIDDALRIAAVGSPSSNFEVTLSLSKHGRHTPLVGSLLAVSNPMGEGSELALGTVTEVTTHNQWHEDKSFQGAASKTGAIKGFSGEEGDMRSATIRLQAAWKRENDSADWIPSGPNLRMSPATGTRVVQVGAKLIKELTVNTEDLHYMGNLGGTDNVPLPLSIPDFSGPAGAISTGVYGLTGSGKAACVNTPIATPDGWTTMGELKDGDRVFDESGNICNVVKAHDFLYGRDCYELMFSDGSKIIADGEHLWQTETRKARAYNSLERSGKKRRQPLLPKEKTDYLRSLARVTHPNETISIPEIAKIAGLDRKTSILETISKRIGSTGTTQYLTNFAYINEQTLKNSKVNVWNKQEVLSALYEESMINGSKFLPSQLIANALVATEEKELVTVGDIADILGRPRRNAGLTAMLKRMPTGYTQEIMPRKMALPSNVTRLSTTITVYPKASFLNAIADHCENLRGDQRHKKSEPNIGVHTTKEIANTLLSLDKKAKNHAIRITKALDLPEVSLPIQPYTLGAWLGDGDSRGGYICGVDHEIAQFIEAEGLTAKERIPSNKNMNKDFRYWTISGLTKILKENQLLQSTVTEGSQKYIPAIYLRSSIEQRKTLLAGLLDTDGTVTDAGGVEFTNTNKKIIDGVYELAISLGYRATIRDGRSKLNSVDYGPKWTVAWNCEESPFRLTRKTNTFNERSRNYNPEKNSFRYIIAVNKVKSVPVRCITVDSPNHLYLIGRSMIPTHNTQAVSYLLAGQMRHENMGIVIVDPQGQWSAEQGMVFSPQGFAAELGRDVRVRRISSDLRLAKDAPLFTNLLKHTRLVVELGLKSEGTQDIVWYEISKVLRSQLDWTSAKSEELLKSILEYLREDITAERVYTTPDNRKAFIGRVTNVLEDPNLFKDALHQFAPIHNLFQETNSAGQERHDLWKTLSEVFNRPNGSPAPLLILDMSSAPTPGMDEEVTEAAIVAQEILEKDTVKAAVLRNLFSTLKRASEEKFRSGVNLNTLVVLDEAWRYAAPANRVDEEELAALSKDLAGYARDTRKFGIGWLYISQSTKSINQDIWDQMSVRLFGYGLSGGDVEKMAEIVDDRNALRLYRTFGNPRATGIYPFLITGPVSPLAANATPLTLQIYTDFDNFRIDNYHWIKAIRDKLGKELLVGQPTTPKGSSAGFVTKLKPKLVKNVREAVIDSSKVVRENRKAVGISHSEGFGDPLGSLEDAPLPFGLSDEDTPF